MDDGAVREAMRGAGDNVGRGVDGEGANRGAAPVDARFGDEDCGEAGVGGGKVGSSFLNRCDIVTITVYLPVGIAVWPLILTKRSLSSSV